MTEAELIDYVRESIRDRAELHTLGEFKEEFTDDDIRFALTKRALLRLNTVPPTFIRFNSVEEVPDALIEPLVLFAISYLLESRVRELSRNNVEYQSGGTGVSFTQMIAEYAQAAQVLREEATMLASAEKIRANLDAAFGPVYSPYRSYGWW